VLVLLLLAGCILSNRIRRGVGFGVLLLGLIALVAWAAAGISGSQDAENVAISTGAVAIFGGGSWLVSSVGAWLLKIATVDVTQDFISPRTSE
jgi:hypothetical protein